MEPAAVANAATFAPWFAAAATSDAAPRDLQAWRECLRELGPRLLLFARQWVSSPADAEDVVQDAFVRCWRRHRERAAAEPALFFAAVRSGALDFLRREQRRRRREQAAALEMPRLDDTPSAFTGGSAVDGERAAALDHALRALPAAQREVLVLKIWGDLTYAQIAEVLAIPPDTAASRARYALAALRKALAASPLP